MKKLELIVLAVSFGLTAAVSTIFGFAGSSIIGAFWGWFWISFLVQFLLFVGYNTFMINKSEAIAQQQEIDLLDKLSKFSVRLSCAYCQQPNTTPIQLNQKNTFKCESCNQTNSVVMQFSAATLTTPIESVKMPLPGSDSMEFRVSR